MRRLDENNNFHINDLPYEGNIPASSDIIFDFRNSLQENNKAESFFNSFQYESTLYRCIREGDVEKLDSKLHTASKQLYFGYFSDDEFRKAQYLYVASITLITRYAIMGGLPEIFAYTLCDVYIKKTDECNNILELWHYFDMAIFDFTRRVGKAKLQSVNSYPVMQSTIYVASHIFEPITLKGAAMHCGVTAPYLSSLFKDEMGMNFGKYTRHEKMKVAAKLLRETNYSILEISTFMSISSSSAFGVQFKDVFGMTPLEYRNKTSYDSEI